MGLRPRDVSREQQCLQKVRTAPWDAEIWLTNYSKSKRYTYTHKITDGAHLQKAVSTYNKGESLWYKSESLKNILDSSPTLLSQSSPTPNPCPILRQDVPKASLQDIRDEMVRQKEKMKYDLAEFTKKKL